MINISVYSCPFCGYPKMVKNGFTGGRPRLQVWRCQNPAFDRYGEWECRRRTTKPVVELPGNLLQEIKPSEK